MNALTKIEERHQFAVPRAYRVFAERGYLTYPGDAYLFVHEAEWVPMTDIPEYRWWFAQPKPGLVPFAFTGGGDLWCWNLQRMNPLGEPAVVYCPHDDIEGHWHAPSFIGWLYRLSLEYASSMWDSEAETKQNVAVWNRLVREFGNAEWADDLDEILKRSPVEYETGSRRMGEKGLLTDEELDARVGRAFGDEYVNAPFICDENDGQTSESDPATLNEFEENQKRRKEKRINDLNEGQGPPCPTCGIPLRTSKAKQCFKCGANWHGH